MKNITLYQATDPSVVSLLEALEKLNLVRSVKQSEPVSLEESTGTYYGILNKEEAEDLKKHLQNNAGRMGPYLVDTNVLSSYLIGGLDQPLRDFLKSVVDRKLNISVITAIELLSWVIPAKETQIRALISRANVIALSETITSECVKIRRGKKVNTPDAIIAATVITERLILITNDADFGSIRNLQVFNLDSNFR